ncbi:MAG: pyridoxamine 5'-phosphate oxidase family protein [Myxococcota bacterium]
MQDPVELERGDQGLEPLSQAECERRLRAGGVGILAMTGSPAPVLRPVNFAVHDGGLLMRTGEGRILEAAARGEPASFVVSEVDRFEHTGFSVVVSGTLAAFEREASEALAQVALRPWARADKHHFVRLSIDAISGRRLAEWGFPP